MFRRKALALATLSTIVCSSAAEADDGFKSSKFLTYPPDAQRSYITSSVVMASLIAGENSEKHAECIRGWINREVGAGYSPVLEAMGRFPDYHPTGVILAVLNKACGPFKYGAK